MLIGLGGKMRSGKSTVAEHLVQKYGFVNLTFAAKLKEIIGQVLGVDPSAKPREALQSIGMAFRALDEGCWVRPVVDQIKRQPPGTSIVVSDVRMWNEMCALRGLGFTMIRVWVPRHIYMRRLQREGLLGVGKTKMLRHQSEIELDANHIWDHALLNDGTVEALCERADTMIAWLSKGGGG